MQPFLELTLNETWKPRSAGRGPVATMSLAGCRGSLGGARPKASVRDEASLFVAKFPHRGDEWDVMAWEKTALALAERADIETPSRRLLTVDGRSVLIVQRFDRHGDRRIGYMSAMTLVGGQD